MIAIARAGKFRRDYMVSQANKINTMYRQLKPQVSRRVQRGNRASEYDTFNTLPTRARNIHTSIDKINAFQTRVQLAKIPKTPTHLPSDRR